MADPITPPEAPQAALEPQVDAQPTDVTEAPAPGTQAPTHTDIYDISGKEPVLGQVPHEQLQEAVLSGKYSLPQGIMIPVHSPDGELGSIPSEQAKEAFSQGYTYATPQNLTSAKYSTPEQHLKTAGEGLVSGFLGPLTEPVLSAYGVDPAETAERAKENPLTKGIAEGAGFGISAATGYGEGALLAKAGEGAAAALGLGAKGAGFISQVGGDAVNGAFQGALMQGGQELYNAVTGDPNFGAEHAAANITLSTVMGGVFGGGLGAALRGTGKAIGAVKGKFNPGEVPHGGGVEAPLPEGSFVSEVDMPAVEAGDFKASVEHSDILTDNEKEGLIKGLDKEKPSAPELRRIEGEYPELNGLLMEGHVSADPMVQALEGDFIASPITYTGKIREAKYRKGWNNASNIVDGTLGEGATLTAAENGNLVRGSLDNKVREMSKPHTALFNVIRAVQEIIPVEAGAMNRFITELKTNPDLQGKKGFPSASLVNRVLKNTSSLKTADSIKNFKTTFWNSVPATADIDTMHTRAIITDMLTELEDHTVMRAATKLSGGNREAFFSPELVNREAAPSAKTWDSFKPELKKGSFSSISAENPGEVISMERNALRSDKMENELIAMGAEYKKVKARHGGSDENSFVVQHSATVTPEVLEKMAQDAGQESILHTSQGKHQMKYFTGKNAGKIQSGEGYVLNPKATDNYTQYSASPNSKYTANINDAFEVPGPRQTQPGELIHYSQHEAPLSEISPDHMGTGAAGHEMRRGPDIVPRSSYYEPGSVPEGRVIQGAKNVYHIKHPGNILDLAGEEAGILLEKVKAANPDLVGDEITTALEHAAKKEGYAGFKNSKGPLPGAINLFEAQPVIHGEPRSPGHFEDVNRLRQGLQEGQNIESLIAKRKEANGLYKEFITKVQELAERLGKGKIKGMEDALHFINNKLTPEDISSRLFSKKDSEFLKFFDKNFPEEAAMMRDYQKGVLRRNATNAEGVFNPKDLIKQVVQGKKNQGMEPEIQRALFSKEELKKINDMNTFLQSFPKDPNPSGTTHLSSLHEAFSNPVGYAKATARDFMAARFIKAVSASPQVKQAVSLAKATVAGEKEATQGVKNLFNPEKAPASAPTEASRNKLSKMVDALSKDPEKMLTMNESNPVKEYAGAFAATTARAVAYLGPLRPNTEPQSPLDTRMPASPWQKATYNAALDIAQNPVHALTKMKIGTLTPQDVITLKTIYPSYYQSLSGKLMDEVTTRISKGQSIPYQTRLQMSMFMGQPLDSTMTPAGIMGAQPAPKADPTQQQGGGKPPSASSVKGLKNVSETAMTSEQSRQADRAKH